MCEWLSCREWCDVRLVCGGRWFPAHRAVLASVSAFLRRILLSSYTEESPTSILLPDYDLEAMSSVLYYIYNGEVLIQKQKLETFMEIVTAMQIFVDDQCLSNECKSEPLSSNLCNQSVPSKDKIFSLGGIQEGPFITLKKGDHNMDDLLGKHYNNDLDVHDKLVRCEGQDMNKSRFGNVLTSHGDRQRNSFLRDLFIETYPRNGNANGRTAGVPAIPNKCYRGAASVLLTNANGKHHPVDDKLSALHKETILTSQCSRSPNITKPQNCGQNAPLWNGEPKLKNLSKISHIKSFDADHTSYLSSQMFSPSMLNNFDMTKDCFGYRWIDQFPPHMNHGFSRLTVKSFSDLHEKKELHTTQTDCNKRYSATVVQNGFSAKGTILNQVMESPWCPRQPNSYRPFRRKAQSKLDLPQVLAKESAVNDDNNNVQTSQITELSERIPSPSSALELSHLRDDSGDFKCNVCNQVFSDSDALAIHTRRHSSSARYSCPECSKSFSQLRNFKYHMSIHRGTREFAATCSVCGKYFNDRGYLSSHMKIHRNRKEYKCSQCPKSFNQRVAYNMHVRIHTGIKPHVCNECGKAFSRKMLLKQHQRTHSGERPYACPHCDKRFADRSNMTLHLRLHTGIKPFCCTLCPKSFTKKHHLKSHLNFHTGAKPYSCPKCKLSFTQSSNMRTHMKKCKAPESTNIAEPSTS